MKPVFCLWLAALSTLAGCRALPRPTVLPPRPDAAPVHQSARALDGNVRRARTHVDRADALLGELLNEKGDSRAQSQP